MASALRIAFAASEITPFAKTGGLADVSAALPLQLHRLGHDVRLFTPLYSTTNRDGRELLRVDLAQDVEVKLGWRTYRFSLWTTALAEDGPSVFFVDCPDLYHRSQIYTSDVDEPQRFALFSRAILESCQRMGWAPAVIHCNDWHTALVPLMRRTVYDWDTLFSSTRTLLTIHNIGYQGVFGADAVEGFGLADWGHMFDQDDLREGRVNCLRTGLIYADLLSTVSPTYAQEIQTDAYGMGLAPLLRSRSERLVGILNGVDYDVWSPEQDVHIPHRFSRKRPAGKKKNKSYLLSHLGFNGDEAAPLLGIVSRLAEQKGFDLCVPVLPEVLATTKLSIVALGTGEARYEEFFSWLQQRFPGRVVFHQGHHDELAHVIEAGADMLLMPSRYEPCGLNQMFSLRYGTIPIVRRTGGLADTVHPFDPQTGEGTGFVFQEFAPDGLRRAIDQALRVYGDRPAWERLISNAMAENFSWETQAHRYVEIYSWLLQP
jgi:starch synthase